MAYEDVVDEHLVAVVNEVLDVLYQAKQASWSASTSPRREDLHELVTFLIEQSARFMVAEERVDGRSDAITAPSSHQHGNLIAESHGDLDAAVDALAQRLRTVIADVRARAAAIPDAPEAPMLVDLADGLEARVLHLQSR